MLVFPNTRLTRTPHDNRFYRKLIRMHLSWIGALNRLAQVSYLQCDDLGYAALYLKTAIDKYRLSCLGQTSYKRLRFDPFTIEQSQ